MAIKSKTNSGIIDKYKTDPYVNSKPSTFNSKPSTFNEYGDGSGNSLTTNTISNSSVYDDALAKAKREQNYKSYYNTAIQAYNMKNRAQKYLDNALASQGLNTQGYGSSAHVGINNEALNLYAQAQSDYNNNEMQITEDAINRYDQKQTEQDNQLITFIQNAIDNGDKDAINKYLQNYGYLDEYGNQTDKWNNLDDDRKAFIQSVIDGKDLGTANDNMGNYYNNQDAFKAGTYINRNGEVYTLGEGFSNECNELFTKISNGTYKYGTTIHMKNKWGDDIYLEYTKDGVRQITKQEYINSDKQQDEITQWYKG